MVPRWSPPIPQPMQRHCALPKNAPSPKKAKPAEGEAIEPEHGTPEPQDRAAA